MAEQRGHGDERATKSAQGQQSGSKRPRGDGGSDRPAPKKGDMPPKGTRQPGAAKRSQPSKGGGMEPKGGGGGGP
jgi:hypothetical protein